MTISPLINPDNAPVSTDDHKVYINGFGETNADAVDAVGKSNPHASTAAVSAL